jgi:hypothetical protein
MNNPYLEEYNKFISCFPGDSHPVYHWRERDELVRKYSWAIPNSKAIRAIAALNKPIIEMGAGKGYWASLLNEYGVTIECFDKYVVAENGATNQAEAFYKVKVGSYEILKKKKYKDYALMLCWPPFDNKFAFNCLSTYQGDTLIYIGEDAGGCTGCDKFHDELNKSWELIETISIPCYTGIYDELYIYRRKKD